MKIIDFFKKLFSRKKPKAVNYRPSPKAWRRFIINHTYKFFNQTFVASSSYYMLRTKSAVKTGQVTLLRPCYREDLWFKLNCKYMTICAFKI